MRGVDRRGDDAVLERQTGMRHAVILDPRPSDAEPRRQARRVDERREAGVEREYGLSLER